MTKVAKLTEQGPHELVEGVRMFPFWGDGMMMNLVDLDPNAVVPLHSHPHEQMGLVVSGQITMTIDGVRPPAAAGGVLPDPGRGGAQRHRRAGGLPGAGSLPPGARGLRRPRGRVARLRLSRPAQGIRSSA